MNNHINVYTLIKSSNSVFYHIGLYIVILVKECRPNTHLRPLLFVLLLRSPPSKSHLYFHPLSCTSTKMLLFGLKPDLTLAA
mgnify:CR=1 FL=1